MPEALRSPSRQRRVDTTLSVCCMTGGRAPDRLAAVLSLLRPLASEIIVAVESDHAEDVESECRGVADEVVSFPGSDPADRAIPWLFAQCSSAWIFNIDDDEVPSRELLARLPALLDGSRITHAWVGRRWLYPDAARYLDEAPWRPDYQLRLLQADPRFLQYSAAFHRPVVATGPAAFVDAPLWHLDCLVNSTAGRLQKALSYERARRGIRVAGVSHNTAFYVPELRPGARTAPVPDDERRAIELALAGEDPRERPAPTRMRVVGCGEVDAHAAGPPYPDSLYAARLELRDDVPSLVAGVQQTVDVLVTNSSDRTWRWGVEAQPQIHVSYRWIAGGGTPVELEGLRTALPCDLAPGATELVPVHVLPPPAFGPLRLEIDLVHEHVRWFNCPVRCDVVVRPRSAVAVMGEPSRVDQALDAIALLPALEPRLLEPDAELDVERFGHERLPGYRNYVLAGLERSHRAAVLGSILTRSGRLMLAASAMRRARRPRFVPADVADSLSRLAACDLLVIAGPDWPPTAAPRRERLRLAATGLAARALGLDVLVVGDLDGSAERLDRLPLGVLRACARALADTAELVSVLAGRG